MLEELKVVGKSAMVTVKTLTGDCKHWSLAVDDLEVANVEEKQADWITFLITFELHPMKASSSWYIPHYSVYHPQKPDKIRVIFDCSSKKHLRFLTFLWCKDGKYEYSVIDGEMNVHVFGATSSPGCSNYALIKSKSSEILHQNFYVDDMLKSVKSEEEAVGLINDVKLICKSGGFHLTKFQAKNKQVLEAVPACDRRKSVVKSNFNNQSLPT